MFSFEHILFRTEGLTGFCPSYFWFKALMAATEKRSDRPGTRIYRGARANAFAPSAWPWGWPYEFNHGFNRPDFGAGHGGYSRFQPRFVRGPGKDFFTYANGGWLARNPIPAEEAG